MRSDRTERDAQDHVLVHRIAVGDDAALHALVDRYSQSLANIAMCIVDSADVAQDTVQDTFIWFWNHREQLHIRDSVFSYLARAVRNRAKNLIQHDHVQKRLKDRVTALDAYTTPDVPPDSEATLMAAERNAAIREAFGQLPPRAREVLLMRIDAGMSYAEIASTLGIAISTVDAHLSRAMKHLATRLSRWKDILLLFVA